MNALAGCVIHEPGFIIDALAGSVTSQRFKKPNVKSIDATPASPRKRILTEDNEANGVSERTFVFFVSFCSITINE
jgi:hypothetical protein